MPRPQSTQEGRVMGKHRRLRDLFSGRTAPPDTDAHPQSYEVDDLIEEACDGDEPDVEGIARVCSRHHARLWDKVEDMFLREKRKGT